MIDVVLDGAVPGAPRWIDLTGPTPEELARVGAAHGVPQAALAECVALRQLPKHERLDGTTFVITRVYDLESRPEAGAFPEMTRKVSMFLGDRFLVTIHSRPLPFLEALKERVRSSQEPIYLQVVMLEILLAGVETFHAPLEQAELMIHDLEAKLLEEPPAATIAWKDVFRNKVRIQTFRRLLWHTQNATTKYVPRASINQPLAEELRERIASLSFFAETLDDDVENLLAVQLSLAANRTSDVMRTLTLFSAVFLPITFIVGVYGMNFRRMPELGWPHGYLAVWIAIAVTVGGILTWFRRRGLTR